MDAKESVILTPIRLRIRDEYNLKIKAYLQITSQNDDVLRLVLNQWVNCVCRVSIKALINCSFYTDKMKQKHH